MKDQSAPAFYGSLGTLLYALTTGIFAKATGIDAEYFLSGSIVIFFLIGYSAHKYSGWKVAALSGVIVETFELFVIGPALWIFGIGFETPMPAGIEYYVLLAFILAFVYSFALFFTLSGAIVSRVQNGKYRGV
jgi:hypothetical protein